ncbi:PREDICTED: putative glycosyltransferase 7 [Nelumbo nucifera]|uniref:Glycosyltransferase 7 n=1 Tax=Nelumbo nucifera TaxID=4432 RepID=A0A1U8BAD2_NELNU|nr:PREDICTED: putative glycosyltransferase 7 [Nelumbo nucifera]
MVAPEQSPLHTGMAKTPFRTKTSSFLTDAILFVGGAMVALLLVWSLWSFVEPTPNSSPNFSSPVTQPNAAVSEAFSAEDCAEIAASGSGVNLRHDTPAPTFYDDPYLSYTIDKPMKNWDEKRREWLKHHPSFIPGASERVLLVSGSQPSPCRNPIGDHLLLRFFKNKVDYCRIHGYDIFYNNVLFHPKMKSFWAKIPVVRAAMIAHPEAEWIWWVDSDAAFTDMEFKLPLERYKEHNMVLHGWTDLIYDKRSWTSLNAGVFLIRNCQWSMEFMDAWAKMGPQTPNYDKWGKTQRSTLSDKLFPEADDQSGLVYLLLEEKEKWADKIYLEGEYYFEGYWLEIVGTLNNITDKYVGMEKEIRGLRRRHAEKVMEHYSLVREPFLKAAGNGRGSWRRPFITHFTGCQPCSGEYNQMYSGDSCWQGMEKALNFADNQVLRSFGFMHRDLQDSSSVSPLPFDYPA